MNSGTVYVVDTHALIFLLKDSPRLGKQARRILTNPASHLVVPVWCFEELRQKVTKEGPASPKVPPTPCLRLVGACRNMRILARGSGVLVEESRLQRPFRRPVVPQQDLQICATALAIRRATGRTVAIITRDREISKWGEVPVIW